MPSAGAWAHLLGPLHDRHEGLGCRSYLGMQPSQRSRLRHRVRGAPGSRHEARLLQPGQVGLVVALRAAACQAVERVLVNAVDVVQQEVCLRGPCRRARAGTLGRGQLADSWRAPGWRGPALPGAGLPGAPRRLPPQRPAGCSRSAKGRHPLSHGDPVPAGAKRLPARLQRALVHALGQALREQRGEAARARGHHAVASLDVLLYHHLRCGPAPAGCSGSAPGCVHSA